LYGELQSWRGAGAGLGEGRGKQPLHAGRDERREPEDSLRGLGPGRPRSKAKQLYCTQASHQAFKQANKQTTLQPFSELRERVSGYSDAGRPAACQAARCREGPRTRWQRSGVRKLIPTGGPQLLLLDVFGSMSLHSPLPRMGTLVETSRDGRGLGRKRQSLDEGEPGSRVGARSKLKRWNTRARESQARFGTLFEALWVKKVE